MMLLLEKQGTALRRPAYDDPDISRRRSGLFFFSIACVLACLTGLFVFYSSAKLVKIQRYTRTSPEPWKLTVPTVQALLVQNDAEDTSAQRSSSFDCSCARTTTIWAFNHQSVVPEGSDLDDADAKEAFQNRTRLFGSQDCEDGFGGWPDDDQATTREGIRQTVLMGICIKMAQIVHDNFERTVELVMGPLLQQTEFEEAAIELMRYDCTRTFNTMFAQQRINDVLQIATRAQTATDLQRQGLNVSIPAYEDDEEKPFIDHTGLWEVLDEGAEVLCAGPLALPEGRWANGSSEQRAELDEDDLNVVLLGLGVLGSTDYRKDLYAYYLRRGLPVSCVLHTYEADSSLEVLLRTLALASAVYAAFMISAKFVYLQFFRINSPVKTVPTSAADAAAGGRPVAVQMEQKESGTVREGWVDPAKQLPR